MLQKHAFRLHPGQDLKNELINYCQRHHIQAATLLSGVGSLTVANLRLSDQKSGRIFQGPFEIVSLIGTLSAEGVHLHIAIADSDGTMIGGHLLDGCVIHTTAEIVLLEDTALQFTRELDPKTGYKELVVRRL